MASNFNFKLKLPHTLPGPAASISLFIILLGLFGLLASLFFAASHLNLLTQVPTLDQTPASLNQRVIEQAASLLRDETVQFVPE